MPPSRVAVLAPVLEEVSGACDPFRDERQNPEIRLAIVDEHVRVGEQYGLHGR